MKFHNDKQQHEEQTCFSFAPTRPPDFHYFTETQNSNAAEQRGSKGPLVENAWEDP